jgi:hypothetical protein
VDGIPNVRRTKITEKLGIPWEMLLTKCLDHQIQVRMS